MASNFEGFDMMDVDTPVNAEFLASLRVGDPDSDRMDVDPPVNAQLPAPLPVGPPKITNIVCGVHLNCALDLDFVARTMRNSSYPKKRFPAVILRHRDPKSTALIFKSGKMQVLGTRTMADAHLACRKYTRMIQRIGYQPRMEDFSVSNIVANVDTRMVIALEHIALHHHHFAVYEPELFPGLSYKMLEPKVTVLVFAKGKVVFVGAKEEGQLDEALRKIYPVLVQARKV